MTLRFVFLFLIASACALMEKNLDAAALILRRNDYPLMIDVWNSKLSDDLWKNWQKDLSQRTLTFPVFKEAILSGAIKSVEELMDYLPEDYRREYALLYKSRSGSKTSFRFPRMLLHGIDARIIFAINGDPRDPRFNKVELSEQSPGQLPNFYKIQFAPGQKAKLSEPNPYECRSCHVAGLDHPDLAKHLELGMRWNWNGYFFWEGAYFSNDDDLTNRRLEGKNMRELAVDPMIEREGFIDFLKESSELPRYAKLLKLRERFKMDGDSMLSDKARPNFELSKKLVFRNFERLAVLILSRPELAVHFTDLTRFFSSTSDERATSSLFNPPQQSWIMGPLQHRVSSKLLHQLVQISDLMGLNQLSAQQIEAHLTTLISSEDSTYRVIPENVLKMDGHTRIDPGVPFTQILKLVKRHQVSTMCGAALLGN